MGVFQGEIKEVFGAVCNNKGDATFAHPERPKEPDNKDDKATKDKYESENDVEVWEDSEDGGEGGHGDVDGDDLEHVTIEDDLGYVLL